MLTLYQAEWCPYCHRVRQTLTELGLTYVAVNVPARRSERAELLALTGQDAVPALQDGDRIVTTSGEIIRYLEQRYPAPEDREEHMAMGAYRNVARTSLTPRAAAARLRELLGEHGFTILAQVPGHALSGRFPEGYLLVLTAVPSASLAVLEADPAVPSGVALPFAIVPAAEGALVACPDPVGPVWVYGEVALNQPLSALRDRLAKLFAAL
jgi:glutaredoxin